MPRMAVRYSRNQNILSTPGEVQLSLRFVIVAHRPCQLREFELFPGSDDVGKYNGIVMRPFDRHDFPRAINYNVIVRKIEK